METYTANDMTEHGRPQLATHYAYNDPGRFDVCRCCPLKLALLALREKHA
jgi:hypothetical protein